MPTDISCSYGTTARANCITDTYTVYCDIVVKPKFWTWPSGTLQISVYIQSTSKHIQYLRFIHRNPYKNMLTF